MNPSVSSPLNSIVIAIVIAIIIIIIIIIFINIGNNITIIAVWKTVESVLNLARRLPIDLVSTFSLPSKRGLFYT